MRCQDGRFAAAFLPFPAETWDPLRTKFGREIGAACQLATALSRKLGNTEVPGGSKWGLFGCRTECSRGFQSVGPHGGSRGQAVLPCFLCLAKSLITIRRPPICESSRLVGVVDDEGEILLGLIRRGSDRFGSRSTLDKPPQPLAHDPGLLASRVHGLTLRERRHREQSQEQQGQQGRFGLVTRHSPESSLDPRLGWW